MKTDSLRDKMVEEIGRLTTEELRDRLLSAEHLIYVLEALLKDAKQSDSRGLLYGNDLYNLTQDEKAAREVYEAARKE